MSDEQITIKKRKSRIESEKRILDAALSVFSEVGFEGASIQMIAARANVNSALIIRYFGSKSDLLKAIILSGCEEGFSEFKDSPPADNLEDEIYRFFLSEINIDFEHYDFIRLVYMRTIVDPEIQEVVKKIIHAGEFRDDLVDCLRPFQERGEIRADIDLKEVSQVLLHHSFGFGTLIHLMHVKCRVMIESKAKLAAKIFASGLRSVEKSPRNEQDPVREPS